MRSLAVVMSIVLVSACGLEPRLAPAAVGCYALESDPIPATYRKDMVPEPPHLLRLDSVHGGQVQVPVSWLEAQGIGLRSASLTLLRPATMIIDGVPIAQSKPFRPLPADSIGLSFSGGLGPRDGRFVAWFAALPSGDWQARTVLQSSRTPNVADVVPMRLKRMACDTTALGISR